MPEEPPWMSTDFAKRTLSPKTLACWNMLCQTVKNVSGTAAAALRRQHQDVSLGALYELVQELI